MGDIRVLHGNRQGRRIAPVRELTFRLLQLAPDDDRAAGYARAYDRLSGQVARRLVPKAAAAMGALPDGRPALFLVMTLGAAVSRYVEALCAGGDSMEALLCGAMADSCLFAFAEQLQPELRRLAAEQHCGICGQLELENGLTAADVRRAVALTEAARILGVTAGADGMLRPVKSMCFAYALCEEEATFAAGHDCARCAAAACPLRQETGPGQKTAAEEKPAAGAVVPGDVQHAAAEKPAAGAAVPGDAQHAAEEKPAAGAVVPGDAQHAAAEEKPAAGAVVPGDAQHAAEEKPGRGGMMTVVIPPRTPVLSALRAQGFSLTAPCGGRGICGKCRVQVVRGALPVAAADRNSFTEGELSRGWRLACRANTSAEPVTVAFREERGFAAPGAEKTAGRTAPQGAFGEERGGCDTAAGRTEAIARHPDGVGVCGPLRDAARRFGMAIDLGSTTIAAALVDLDTGQTVGAETGLNRQRAFGADVVSRIEAAVRGEGMALRRLVQEDLSALLGRLLARFQDTDGFPPEAAHRATEEQASGRGTAAADGAGETPPAQVSVAQIVLAGNTVMEHLLLGLDCAGLASWPFHPATLGDVHLPAGEVLGAACPAALRAVDVWLLPGFSAYVGADIAAGLAAEHFSLTETARTRLLVDLGTNGEMALLHGGRLFVASTSAGPAFEGGRLSCGVGSVPGAICAVTYVPEHRESSGRQGADAAPQSGDVAAYLPGVGALRCETIGGAPPVGLCGTGAVEALAALRASGLADAYGTLAEPYFETGVPLCGGADAVTRQAAQDRAAAAAPIRPAAAVAPEDGGNAAKQPVRDLRLTQDDIREIQMAKGAIRAGMACLARAAGVALTDVDEVVLAGGFGFYLRPEKAAAIGLLPRELAPRTRAAGNTSLAGAKELLLHPSRAQELRRLCRAATEDVLGADPLFQDQYLAAINLPEQ